VRDIGMDEGKGDEDGAGLVNAVDHARGGWDLHGSKAVQRSCHQSVSMETTPRGDDKQ
jgi:hypothetical protein